MWIFTEYSATLEADVICRGYAGIPLQKAFEQGKAFIPFITCGDPDLETTAAVVRAAVKNGADLIELGIPFSDPTAEGPVIQGANLRALQGGVTTDTIFDLVRQLRRDVTVSMVFQTVKEPVFSPNENTGSLTV